MRYDVESALRNKADNWKVFDLENSITRLKNDNRELTDEARSLRNELNTQRDIINRIAEAIDSVDIPNMPLIREIIYY